MGVGIGVSIIGGTPAVHLAPGQDLSVDLEPNNGPEVRDRSGDHLRETSRNWIIVLLDGASES